MDDKFKPPLIVFNLTLGIYLLVRMFAARHVDWGFFLWHLLIGAGLGLVTGGITLALFMRRK
jgi:hypothetical protein